MSTVIGSYEAKTHLPQLLDEVASKGTTFTISKHGKPVARLVPIQRELGDRKAALTAFRIARQGLRLNGLSVREMIDEGRR